jgi:PhoD related phosphatase
VHALLGGGDQLYNDNLWAEPGTDAWLKLGPDEQVAFQPDSELKAQIAHYYLHSYLRHTHFHPAAEFLRSTPQVNTWDDHDIFDGWGSYPPQLQNCALFAAIIREAHRFYLAFQLATTKDHAAADGFLVVEPENQGGLRAVHFVSPLGPSLAVVAPDSRSQRSRERIISPQSTQRLEVAVRVALLCQLRARDALRHSSYSLQSNSATVQRRCCGSMSSHSATNAWPMRARLALICPNSVGCSDALAAYDAQSMCADEGATGEH